MRSARFILPILLFAVALPRTRVSHERPLEDRVADASDITEGVLDRTPVPDTVHGLPLAEVGGEGDDGLGPTLSSTEESATARGIRRALLACTSDDPAGTNRASRRCRSSHPSTAPPERV